MSTATATAPVQRGDVRPRSRPLLLAAVAVCAACGLVYELVLLTLSASLTGGGITQTSLIVASVVLLFGAVVLASLATSLWAESALGAGGEKSMSS